MLESRVLPADVSFAGGVLGFLAADGEDNDVSVDVVQVGGVDYVRLREEGAGVAMTTAGAGLIVDSATTVRAAAADVTQVEIDTGDGDDTVTLALADAGLPAAIAIDGGGQDAADHLKVLGTPGDDAISLAPDRILGGLDVVEPDGTANGHKAVDLVRGGSTVQFLGFEAVTLDLSQDGNDAVTVDRYITSLGQTMTLNVVGGGAGADTLAVSAPGAIPQTVAIDNGSLSVGDAAAGSETLLGPSDNIAIDQPQVQIEVIDDSDPDNPVSFGPDDFNTLLLDTGATSILFASEATAELTDAGYQTEGQYDEQGVAGFTTFDVSKPYRVDFAGYSGVRNTLENFRVESSPDLSFSFLGPWGIVGMPAMVNRVTTIDMSSWEDLQNSSDPEDLEMKTDFGQDSPPDSGHLRHVPLTLVDFPENGQHGNDPLPDFAPVSYLPVTVRDNGHTHQGQFLLDTGAQLSIISTKTALELGLDRNGDGSLEDEAIDHIDVGGIGGTVTIPLVPVERLSVHTEEGDDLVWTNLVVGVQDIDVENGPELAGVFGMDFLTSGWAAKVLPLLTGDPASTDDGYFDHVYLDYRAAAQHQGTLVLDVDPLHDHPGAPDATPLVIQHSGLASVSVATGSGDDVFNVHPSATTALALDGGPHVAGDTLNLLPAGQPGSDDGKTISIPGDKPIQHVNIETINGLAAATFRVASMTPNDSGVVLRFNGQLDPSNLNLYDTATAGLGPADLTLNGASTGPVHGSLVIAPDGRSATFIRTGGLLPADTYTLHLRSTTDGFRALDGSLLDGDADSNAGGDYNATFTVAPPPAGAVTVSVPDLVRGPGQSADVPVGTLGLPVRLSDGSGVTSATFDLLYNPDLLTITAASPGAGLPAGATVTLDTSARGIAHVVVSSPTALAAGAVDLVRLTAAVPAGAPYTAKEVLGLANVSVHAGSTALATRSDDGLHVVSYPGDLNGDGRTGNVDVTLLRRVIIGLDGGLASFQLADPGLVADLNGDAKLSAIDVTELRRFIIGLGSRFLPDLGPANPTPGGPDPVVFLADDPLGVGPGGALSVPVRLRVTDPSGIALAGVDLAISFDPSRFRVAGLRLGGLLDPSRYDLLSNIDPASGTIRVTISSRSGTDAILGAGTLGDLLLVDFNVLATAAPGVTSINLRASLGNLSTGLGDSAGRGLTLSPAPTDAADDPVDGRVVIVPRKIVARSALARNDGAGVAPVVIAPMPATGLPGISISGIPRPSPRGPARLSRPDAASQRRPIAAGRPSLAPSPWLADPRCLAPDGAG